MPIHSVNLASIDLNLLVALNALLEERSVGRAGLRVGLSQPAMSHALRRLRELLGDPLLVRMGAVMVPTPVAENLASALASTLKQISDLLQTTTFDPNTSTRCFRLGLSDYAASVVMPLLQAHLAAHAPLATLEVLSLIPGPEALVALGPKIDLAITCEDLLPAGFRRQLLFEDEEVLAWSKSMPRKRPTLASFLVGPHVAVAEGQGRPDPVDAWLAGEGHARRIAASVPQYVLALRLISQSSLMAVLPRRLVDRFKSEFQLATSQLPLHPGSFTEYMLHPERVDMDPGNTWIRQSLLKLFRSGKTHSKSRPEPAPRKTLLPRP